MPNDHHHLTVSRRTKVCPHPFIPFHVTYKLGLTQSRFSRPYSVCLPAPILRWEPSTARIAFISLQLTLTFPGKWYLCKSTQSSHQGSVCFAPNAAHPAQNQISKLYGLVYANKRTNTAQATKILQKLHAKGDIVERTAGSSSSWPIYPPLVSSPTTHYYASWPWEN